MLLPNIQPFIRNCKGQNNVEYGTLELSVGDTNEGSIVEIILYDKRFLLDTTQTCSISLPLLDFYKPQNCTVGLVENDREHCEKIFVDLKKLPLYTPTTYTLLSKRKCSKTLPDLSSFSSIEMPKEKNKTKKKNFFKRIFGINKKKKRESSLEKETLLSYSSSNESFTVAYSQDFSCFEEKVISLRFKLEISWQLAVLAAGLSVETEKTLSPIVSLENTQKELTLLKERLRPLFSFLSWASTCESTLILFGILLFFKFSGTLLFLFLIFILTGMIYTAFLKTKDKEKTMIWGESIYFSHDFTLDDRKESTFLHYIAYSKELSWVLEVLQIALLRANIILDNLVDMFVWKSPFSLFLFLVFSFLFFLFAFFSFDDAFMLCLKILLIKNTYLFEKAINGLVFLSKIYFAMHFYSFPSDNNYLNYS